MAFPKKIVRSAIFLLCIISSIKLSLTRTIDTSFSTLFNLTKPPFFKTTHASSFSAAATHKRAVDYNPISNINSRDCTTKDDELCITDYILSCKNINNFNEDKEEGIFYIQGWRWHTLSLIRDAKRLEHLAKRLLLSLEQNENGNINYEALHQATSHVIDFNLRGLYKIENDLFFPWLKQKFTKGSSNNEQCVLDNTKVQRAFENVLDDLEEDRAFAFKIANTLKQQAKKASEPNLNFQKRWDTINNVAQMSAALSTHTLDILEKEEKFLVPAVAAFVPAKEQKSFNNKVIRKLGILDSRLHLVGMHDAVWEKNDKAERELFNEMIPYIPRMMIPRWRRLLYEPQAGVLDYY